MPVSSRLLLRPIGRKAVSVAVVELADGRIVARTHDELEQLPIDEQAAVAAALELEPPTPGKAS